MASSSYTLSYTENDVLLCPVDGRGNIQVESFPGNAYFKTIVTKESPKYKQSNQTYRVRVVERVMEAIMENGGRFLAPADDDGEGWIVLDEESTFDKLSGILGAPSSRKPTKKAGKKAIVVNLIDSDEGSGNDSDSVVFVGSSPGALLQRKRSTRASRGPPRVKPKYAEESSNDDFEDEDEYDEALETASEQDSSSDEGGGVFDETDDDDMLENSSEQVLSHGEMVDVDEEGDEEETPEVVPATSDMDYKVNSQGYRKIDILTGKTGSKKHEHTGHTRFQDITLEYSYKADMHNYVDEIIEKLQSNGARFMMWDPDLEIWVEIEDEKVKRGKVKNALHNAHKRRPSGSRPPSKSPSTRKPKEPKKVKKAEVGRKKHDPVVSLDPVESLVQRVIDDVKSNGARFKVLKQVGGWVDAGDERTTTLVRESLEHYQGNRNEPDSNEDSTKKVASLSHENNKNGEGQANGIGASEKSTEIPKSLAAGTTKGGADGVNNETSTAEGDHGADDSSRGIPSDPHKGSPSKAIIIELLDSDEDVPVPSEVGRTRTPRKAKTLANQHVQALQLAERLDKEEDLVETGRNDYVVADKSPGVVGGSNDGTDAATTKGEGSESVKEKPYTNIDVLIGNGEEKMIKTHPGNIRFYQIIVKFQAEYRELKSIESQPTGRGKRKRTNASDVPAKRSREARPKLDPRLSKISFIQPPEDPNKQAYVEETAHRYHNPPFPHSVVPPEPKLSEEGVEVDEKIEVIAVSPMDLRPIPPPPPLPDFPSTGNCKWSFDEESRVLLADFGDTPLDRRRKQVLMDKEDEFFFLKMLERNDITVISEGLMGNLDPLQWHLSNVAGILDFEFYHKFRRFDHKPTPSNESRYVEVDQCMAMTVGDYVKYLDLREKVLERGPRRQRREEDQDGDDADNDALFTFKDDDEKEHTIDARVSSIYMIDFDLGKYLPRMHADFMTKMLYRGILPGREHCMMSNVTEFAQPFMGPNMYITPPGGFTHFHQDGHGTVDSGHLCLLGYNEVVMLRRLTERHKQHALWLLTRDRSKENDMTFYDGLYQLPHDDGLGEKPSWPSKDAIEECKEMGYCPSVFTLKAGQLVHINKGRLHAFRKMSNHVLPDTDCHSDIRRKLVVEKNLKEETLCISVAWDWMYRGVTVPGINREVVSVLECAALNRKHGTMSLAIPEFCLLQTARTKAPLLEMPKDPFFTQSLIGFDQSHLPKKNKPYAPTKPDLFKGLLPCMRFVINKHLKAIDEAREAATGELASTKVRHSMQLAERPDSYENPEKSTVDPYGNTDFFCKLCHQELSNVYYQCYGCLYILSKDFRICQECHAEKKYFAHIQMHKTNNFKDSRVNHNGRTLQDRAYRTSPNGICPCKRGPDCSKCGYCYACSCRCHNRFIQQYRFYTRETEEDLLLRAEKVSKESQECDVDESLVLERLAPKQVDGEL